MTRNDRPFYAPKIATYCTRIGALDETERGRLALADLLITAGRPERIHAVRQDNPNLKVLWTLMPFHVMPWDDQWTNDLAWSLTRGWQHAAFNCGLKNTQGRLILDASGHRILNWTPYSATRSVLQQTIEAHASSEAFWPKWKWDDLDTVNGIMLEVSGNCLGTINGDILRDADPDLDHEPEGVSLPCSRGGNQEPLTALMAIENAKFLRWLFELARTQGFLVLANNLTRYSGPSAYWRKQLHGMKMENSLRQGWDRTWFDENAETGLRYWRNNAYFNGLTEYTILCQYEQDGIDPQYGLAIALQYDCYYAYMSDQEHQLWHRHMSLDLGGEATGPTRWDGTYWNREYPNYVVRVSPDKTIGCKWEKK